MANTEPGFPDLQDVAREAGVSQARIGTRMGYRPDVFSRVLNGHQPPKGGQAPEQFRREYRRAVRELSGAAQPSAQKAGAR